MRKLLVLTFWLLISGQTVTECPAQQPPPEGYITMTDGVRLFYKIVGSGKETLVAVHGLGGTLESLLPDLEPLAQNRRVIYYDQRGKGRSDLITEREPLAIEKHVSDLEGVRTHFKLDKLTLLGNSWGAILISFYAVAHPDRIERMILHNPGEPTRSLYREAGAEMAGRIFFRYDAVQRRRFTFVSKPENWVKAKDPRSICREYFGMILSVAVAKEESAKRLKGELCFGPKEVLKYEQVVNMQTWRSLGDWNLLPQLGVVKAPVLVIHGPDDLIPVRSSKAWALAYFNARLLLIKDSGHLSHVEQPEVFFKAVETFLKGRWVAETKTIRDIKELRR